jgi:DNA-binding transcriptional LysR family regulator
MDVGQLLAFVDIARRGNLSRSAEALYLTQPAVSARVRRLEDELGSALFVRTARGMRLTATGRTFLPFAQRALDAVAAGRIAVAELERGAAGELSIGAAPAVSTYVLPPLLKRFSDLHPNVRLSVRTGHSEEVLELVLRDQVQVGIVRALRHPDVRTMPLYDDRLVLVAHPDDPLARRGEISIEALADAQLVLFDRTSSYHQLTSALFREAGVTPRGILEVDNIEATKKMVQQGIGVALVPGAAVAADLAGGSLVSVTIKDARPVRRPIVAIRRRDAPSGPRMVRDFVALLEERAPARAEGSPTAQ